MIKLIYGKKGSGKTKSMLETANSIVLNSKGNVVYIDSSDEFLTKLARAIRFINIKEYPVADADALIGFVCGATSQNYDIDNIFIDGLGKIVGDDAEKFMGLLKNIDNGSINYYISLSGATDDVPAAFKEFI